MKTGFGLDQYSKVRNNTSIHITTKTNGTFLFVNLFRKVVINKRDGSVKIIAQSVEKNRLYVSRQEQR